MKKQEVTIDIAVEMRVYIAREYGTQTAAAAAWGYSRAFVSAVLKGRKQPTEKMLTAAGFRKANSPRYERI